MYYDCLENKTQQHGNTWGRIWFEKCVDKDSQTKKDEKERLLFWQEQDEEVKREY